MDVEPQQFYAEGKFAELLAQVDACLPKDEAGSNISEKEKSDVVHDLLAHLAERMLEMNKQKLTIDPARRGPWPRAEFEESVGKLAPLRERIEGTDGLIDHLSAMRAY